MLENPNQKDDELLSQYMDGELSDAERAEFDLRLQNEPQLLARLRSFTELSEEMKEIFVSEEDAVPHDVAAMLEPETVVEMRPMRHTRPQWAPLAMAASLLAGVSFIMGTSFSEPEQAGFAGADALSSPQLSKVMEQHASTADNWYPLGDGARIRPVLSFPASDEVYCREYQLQTPGLAWRGVACRRMGVWRTEILVPGQVEGGGSYYLPASAESNRALDNFIRGEMSGDVLDTEKEAGVIAGGWR